MKDESIGASEVYSEQKCEYVIQNVTNFVDEYIRIEENAPGDSRNGKCSVSFSKYAPPFL